MVRPAVAGEALACCHGYAVSALDGPVGVVETPVFAGVSVEPEALLVRTDAPAATLRIDLTLVAGVDERRRVIVLAANRRDLAGFAETGPIEDDGPDA